MRTERITEKHIKWLKDHYGITFEDVLEMSEEEDDKLCNNLLNDECDALESDNYDEMRLIIEIQDIIYDEHPEPPTEEELALLYNGKDEDDDEDDEDDEVDDEDEDEDSEDEDDEKDVSN